MVARHNRNSVRSHWRDQRGQCERRDSGGGGFYRSFVGRLGLQTRAARGRQTVERFVCAIFTVAALSLAAPILTPTLALAAEAPASSNTNYDKAIKAYGQGDFANALLFAKLAGNGGHTQAQVLAGHILIRGETSTTDPIGAKAWFLKAANLGQSDAMYALGELSLASKAGLTPADAIFWLGQAADKGRTDAMLRLGDMYQKGQGTRADIPKGRKYFVKAANLGDVKALRKLGDLDIDTDPVNALAWYEKAADIGDDQAAHIAAIMYMEYYEIKPNAVRAAQLLAQAANAGIPAAQADYGLVVYQGNGVTKSAQKAAEWFKFAAEGGDPEGRFLYAFTLAKGDGVAQNYEDAYYWLLRAEQDSGPSNIEEYDRSRTELKKRLEENVDSTILTRARNRASMSANASKVSSVQ